MALRNIKKYLAIDDYEGGLTEEVTPWAGVGLFLERRVGIGLAMEQVLPAKESPKGLRHVKGYPFSTGFQPILGAQVFFHLPSLPF